VKLARILRIQPRRASEASNHRAMAPTATKQPRAAAPAPAPAAADTALLLSPRAIHDPITAAILPREPASPVDTPTIPAHYGSLNSGPDPGTVAGITLGSVAGFVLLLWLIYTCINFGNPTIGANDTSTVVTEGTASVYTRRRRSKSRKRNSHRKETVEIRRSGGGGPVIVEEMVSSSGGPSERIIEIERRRSVSRARGPPPPRRVEVESSYLGSEEDEVVVIEERGPRRQRSRVRSVERRSGGFREVDPDRFAGGDGAFVEVRRSGSHHRR
jgi:hypothetical protein